MSIDAVPFDGFGRIMSSGGEQSAALAIGRGYPASRIDSIMLRRFGDDYRESGSAVLGFAAGMLAAGSIANSAAKDGGTISHEQVPINGFLPEEELAGSRYKWAVDVMFEGASAAVTTYIYTSDLDLEGAFDQAIDSGGGTVDDYRKKFGLSDDAILTPTQIQIISIEGGY